MVLWIFRWEGGRVLLFWSLLEWEELMGTLVSCETHECAQCWSVQADGVWQIKADSAYEVDYLHNWSLDIGLALDVLCGWYQPWAEKSGCLLLSRASPPRSEGWGVWSCSVPKAMPLPAGLWVDVLRKAQMHLSASAFLRWDGPLGTGLQCPSPCCFVCTLLSGQR